MRTVLFDLDGTLVDSAALITHHLAGALRAVGAEVPEPAGLMSLVGPPFETALPAIGLTAEQTAAAILHYRSTYDRRRGRAERALPRHSRAAGEARRGRAAAGGGDLEARAHGRRIAGASASPTGSR